MYAFSGTILLVCMRARYLVFYSDALKKSLRLDTLLPNLIEFFVFYDQIVIQQDFESHESRKKNFGFVMQ
jgi:hypothetical protein